MASEYVSVLWGKGRGTKAWGGRVGIRKEDDAKGYSK